MANIEEKKPSLPDVDSEPLNVSEELPDTKGDRMNMFLLFLLYTLQGIPLNIALAMPMLVQKRGASYAEQAQLSIWRWPYSTKCLCAPIVDSCYSTRFGRRKSWIIPTQYFIGAFLIVMSYYINEWMGDGKLSTPSMGILSIVFFALIFTVSMQDIGLDAWALTILKRRNLCYAPICNSLGQVVAQVLSYTLLLSLESAEFCNTWLRTEPQEEGIITLEGFLWFWGLTYLIVTTLVAVLKREQSLEPKSIDKLLAKTDGVDLTQLSLIDNYKLFWKILNISHVKLLIVIMFTIYFQWGAYEGVGSLKFLNAGVSNEKMIPLIALTALPMRLVAVIVATKLIGRTRPAQAFINFIPYRSLFCLSGAIIIWLTPLTLSTDGIAPNYIYFVYLANDIFYMFCLYVMRITLNVTFVRIADPAVGGTYMTMLNTIENIGVLWPISSLLWIVDYITWRDCVLLDTTDVLGLSSNVTQIPSINITKKCPILIDGYYLETIICIVFGVCWYKWGISKLNFLQRLPIDAWRVKSK